MHYFCASSAHVLRVRCALVLETTHFRHATNSNRKEITLCDLLPLLGYIAQYKALRTYNRERLCGLREAFHGEPLAEGVSRASDVGGDTPFNDQNYFVLLTAS